MAENDIYNNEKKYNDFLNNLDELIKDPKTIDKPHARKRKYIVKNKANLKYFKVIDKQFKAKDLSFIRRLRLFRTLLMVSHYFKEDLKNITERKQIDGLMEFSHIINKSIKTKADFVIDLKYIWKSLFPEKDERGREDNTVTPYVVRHISGKIDKSKQKLRGDKFTLAEFEKLMQSYSNDPRMQTLLALTLESLGRPQEILERRIKNVEMHDNYAKVYITEHGKEGTGFLRCIDSYYYLAKWLNEHPLKDDPEAYLFVNMGYSKDGKIQSRGKLFEQLKPPEVNKLLRKRLKQLGINKPITLYSLKRNGVTMRRLSGDSDLEIQHTARWTSTKQLHTYDLSEQEESFKIELIKRGLIKGDGKYKEFRPKTKECPFCKTVNAYTGETCINCKRPLDRQKIIELEKSKDDEIKQLQGQVTKIMEYIELINKADKVIKEK